MPRSGLVSRIAKARSTEGAPVGKAVLVHLDELYRFGLHLTRDPEGAGELVQECVLRALKGPNTVIRAPRNFFFQTLYRAFVDHFRKGVIRKIHAEAYFGEEADIEKIVDPLPSVIVREDVRNAVENLPETFRAVVWLSDAEELPLREVAEILDCPLGTVASRLARGRQELRRLLSAYGREGGT